MNRFSILCAGLACAIAGPAMAADLPVAPPPPILPPPVVYDWTGFYVGVQGGYAGDWGTEDEDDDFDDFDFGRDRSSWVNGFVGGGHIGYLWQFGQFVVGLEGDAEYANINADDDHDWFRNEQFRGYRLGATREYNFLASARLRAGFAFDRWLVYATGGYAYANADVETRYERRFGDADDFDAFDENSLGLNGFTVGAGVDALVTSNLSVGLEYRYTDLENATIVGRRLIDGPEFDSGELKNNFHAIRARIGYHF